jgi:hypothetical protein
MYDYTNMLEKLEGDDVNKLIYKHYFWVNSHSSSTLISSLIDVHDVSMIYTTANIAFIKPSHSSFRIKSGKDPPL